MVEASCMFLIVVSYISTTRMMIRQLSITFLFNHGEVAQGEKVRSILMTVVLSDSPLFSVMGLASRGSLLSTMVGD